MSIPYLQRRLCWCLVCLPFVAGTALAPPAVAEKTDWFHQARWGVMTHYLGAPPSCSGGAELTAEMWNRQVDAFDVEGLAEQIASTGAKYLLFTIGQNSGHYCAPNETSDHYAGISSLGHGEELTAIQSISIVFSIR